MPSPLVAIIVGTCALSVPTFAVASHVKPAPPSSAVAASADGATVAGELVSLVKADTRPADTTRSTRPTDTAPPDTRPTDTRPTDTVPPDTRPNPGVRLSCAPERADDGVMIGCKWTEAPADRVAGYRLLRAIDRQARTVIFETRDLGAHGYRDLVKPGHSYHYAVQYLGSDGAVLATSNVERIRLPDPTDDTRPDPTVRLSCEPHRADDGAVIGCKWTPAPDDRVAGYRLLRAVDDHGRTVVFETRDLDQHGYRDTVRAGHTYRYAVQFVGNDGEVLVTSSVETVRIPAPSPDNRPTDTTPADTSDRRAPAGA